MKQGTCLGRADYSQQPPDSQLAFSHTAGLPGRAEWFVLGGVGEGGQQGNRCKNKETPGTVGIVPHPK